MFLILFIVLVVLRLVGKIKSWWTVFGIMVLAFLFFLCGSGLRGAYHERSSYSYRDNIKLPIT